MRERHYWHMLEGIRNGDADAAEAATLSLIETTAASLETVPRG
jgi:hypothetical protein